MHELAVCQALIDQVRGIAAGARSNRVTDIHLRLGPLSGVEADLLAEAFPIASAGTVARGAALHLKRTPVRVRCSVCGGESRASAAKLVCGDCGEWRTTLVSGDELILERVELERPETIDREETACV